METKKAYSPKNKPSQTVRKRYSASELSEFEGIIHEKLQKAQRELDFILESLDRSRSEDSAPSHITIEEGNENMEREKLSQLAIRQKSFIKQLQNALARIKNGTYGVCVESGKLISKARLRAVPHTTHSIEAKLRRKKD